MKKPAVLLVPVMFFALCTSAWPQRSTKYPTPPSPMNTDNAAATPASDTASLPMRVDLMQVQREADDLARAAQTIPSDVASIRKGMLPKDVIQKLRQIEKLSKQLRSQITQ